jgi:hypothetical protein
MRVKTLHLFIAAVTMETLGIGILFVLVAIFGPHDPAGDQAYAERLSLWVGPVSGTVLCLLFGWILTRRLNSGHVINGLAVGAASVALDILLIVLSGTPFRIVHLLSNAGRLAAAAVGGRLGSK